MKRKWFEYLLEMLVIVFSIIGAFALDNWNDLQKERQEELEYLSSLRLDLYEDLKQLPFMREFRESKISSSKALLNYNVNETLENQSVFFNHLIAVFIWFEFSPNKNTIQELVNSGNLSMIKNDSIIDHILLLNQHLEALNTIREHSRREFEHYLYDRLGLYLDLNDYTDLEDFKVGFTWQIDSTSIEENLIKLKQQSGEFLADRIVRNGLFLAGGNSVVMVKNYEDITDQINKLINTIDSELRSN